MLFEDSDIPKKNRHWVGHEIGSFLTPSAKGGKYPVKYDWHEIE